MPPIPRDPEHDLDRELRALLAAERRALVDAAPATDDLDDPEV